MQAPRPTIASRRLPALLVAAAACSSAAPHASPSQQSQGVEPACGTSGASPSCTRISTTSGAIVDGSDDTWTLAAIGGSLAAFENGAPAGFTANVQALVYVAGVVSHENTSGQWYSWSGSVWNAEADPTASCSPLGDGGGGGATGSDDAGSGSGGGTGEDAGESTVIGAPNLTGYHLSFDWEANDFNWAAVPTSGDWCTTLSATPGSQGLRYLSNGDQECFSDPGLSGANDNPFSVAGGALTITSYPDPDATTLCNNTSLDGQGPAYLSGQITTQGWFAQLHGYFEARLQAPQGIGMWPAFWMLTESSYQSGGWPPELDVLEAFGAPSTTGSYGVSGGENQAHWDVHTQVSGASGGAWATMNADIYSGYHTYGALWGADFITFFYDGAQVAQVATPSDFTLPMYLILNTAVGGWWPGFATGETSAMNIDYVRAFSSDSSVAPVALQPVSSPDGAGANLHGASHL